MLLNNEIQQSIYSRLANDPTLSNIIVKVYDSVPQAEDAALDTDFPYITIGDILTEDWSTDDSSGTESQQNIHIYSRYRGTKEIKDIQHIIYNLLNRYELEVTNANTVLCDFNGTQAEFLEPDGKTRRAVIGFRILLDTV